MQFENNGVRTARRNDFIQYINLINKKLVAKKNGTKVDFSTLSRQVGKTGFEPAAPWSQTRCATGLRHFPFKKLCGEGGIRTLGTVTRSTV